MISQAGYKSVLVHWNFNRNCELALKKAFELAASNARINVIHVAAPLSGPDNGALFMVNKYSHRNILKKRFWKELPEHLADFRINFDVEFGFAGKELIRCSERYKSDLIIVCARERTRFGKLIFGNLSGYLQKHSSCPVSIISSSETKAGSRPAQSEPLNGNRGQNSPASVS